MVGRNGRPAILGRIDIGLRRAADREIGAGNAELRLDEIGEILRAHAFARLVMEYVLAERALERLPHAGGGLGVVDRKSVVTGKSLVVRVDAGGCRIIKK